jgi:hypothetical protein
MQATARTLLLLYVGALVLVSGKQQKPTQAQGETKAGLA